MAAFNDDEEENKEEGGGAPAWLATFADLMSLLLAFFVLLFAMSSVDNQKFKIVGGSLSEAFGVQRKDFEKHDPVLGVNHIAQEFSSGRADPTVLNIVPQENLNVDSMRVRSENASDTPHQHTRGGEQVGSSTSTQKDPQSGGAQTKNEEPKTTIGLIESSENEQSSSSAQKQSITQQDNPLNTETADAQATETAPKGREEKQAENKKYSNIEQQADAISPTIPLPIGALNDMEQDSERKRLENELANAVRKIFQEEEQEGTIEIEVKEGQLILRLGDEGLFPPGSAETAQPFIPLIEKMSDVIRTVDGEVTVAGHTDSIPTRSPRYRSNWELSTSRAVTVVQGLLDRSGKDSSQFQVHGYGDSRPVADNSTAVGRAKNRRVEVIVELDQIASTLPERLQELVQQPEPETPDPQDVEEAQAEEIVQNSILSIPSPIFNRERDTNGRPDYIFGSGM